MMSSVKMRCMNVLHFLCMAVLCACCIWFYVPANHLPVAAAALLVNLVLTAFLYRVYNAYRAGEYSVGELLYAQTLANVLALGVSYVLLCILRLRLLSLWPAMLTVLAQTLLSLLWSIAATHLYFALHAPKRTLVIYRTDTDLDKLREISAKTRRFDLCESLCDPTDIHQIIPALEGFEAVFVSGIEATLRNGILKECIDKNIDCYFVPHTGDVIVAGAQHVQSLSVPIMRAQRSRVKPEYAFAKRAFDIVCASIALVLASPFLLGTAIAVKLEDGGPVFYRQVRLTQNGRRFQILKFRSMRVDAEKDGVARLATEHDDRITRVGHVIRAIRFDELPQILNILRGDMSFVGPRPERPEIAAQYEQEMPAFSLRLQVKAGLTGTAQVYGRYNTEPKDKLKMDLMYINNMSPLEDLRLMFATARILLLKDSTEGIADGQTTATAEKMSRSV